MKRKRLGVVFFAVCVLFLSGCANAMQEGVEHLEQKEYSEAVKSFETVIQDGKNVGKAYHGQGIAYWELKEYDKAKEALERALENGVEGTANLYQTLGDSCMQLEKYEEALSSYWKGMACDGLTEEQLQDMLYNEVMAYEGLKDWDGAKVKMEAYVAKYPDDENAKKEAEFLETR